MTYTKVFKICYMDDIFKREKDTYNEYASLFLI